MMKHGYPVKVIGYAGEGDSRCAMEGASIDMSNLYSKKFGLDQRKVWSFS